MSFMGIGPVEMVVILAVALIAFGPQRLPELARYLAKAMKMFREASREIQNQLEMSDWDKPPRKPYKPKKQIGSNTTGTDSSSSSPYSYDSSYPDGTYGGETSSSDSTPESAAGDSNSSPYMESPTDTENLASKPAAEEPIMDPEKTEDANRYAREMND